MINTDTKTELKLAWGYNQGLPADCAAAWGARAIVELQQRLAGRGRQGRTRRARRYLASLVCDRQACEGSPSAKAELLALLNAGRITKSLREAERQLDAGAIYCNERKHTELYRDDQVVIVGNTNASCGYLYLCGYLTADQDQDH